MSTFSVTQTGLSNYGPNNNGYSIGNRKESGQDFLAATQKEEEEKERMGFKNPTGIKDPLESKDPKKS